MVFHLEGAHQEMIRRGGLVAPPTPIRSALRFVDGTLEVLEATLESHGWRLHVVRNGRETQSTRKSKWHQVESAFQIFALGTDPTFPVDSRKTG